MTPEQKFNLDIWWILQEIKKDKLLTPKGEKIDFSLRKLTNSVGELNHYIPQKDTQRKLLFKLKDWKAINLKLVDDVLRGSDILNPQIYKISIKEAKFNELYSKYESINKTADTYQIQSIKNTENGKLPYKKDGLLYSLWKYANANRLTGKSLISFSDLVPLEGNQRFVILEFLNNLQELGIELENITFHENIYKKYCKTEHKYLKEYIKKNSDTPLSNSIKNLFINKATHKDVYVILGNIDSILKIKLQLDGLLEFIEFRSKPSEKNISSLEHHLKTYLHNFINDNLYSFELKNYYCFSRQKEIFLDQIKNDVCDFGKCFVFKHGEITSVRKGSMVSIGKDEAFLFIHILTSLEMQKYFTIESILIVNMEIPPEEQTDDYKIKIIGSDKLIFEFNSEHKTKQTNQNKIYYKNQVLFIDNQEIDFSTKPIQADLLNTLFKEPDKIWSNDEIWEDWGEKDFLGKTLKFYTAGSEINKIVKEKTEIEKFLNINTKKISINPAMLGNIR